MDVFLLWHVHGFPDGEEDAKLLGVYSSRELADQARRRALLLPGFRDVPNGFQVSTYSLDKDCWTEGYVTQTHEDVVREWEADQAGRASAARQPERAPPTDTNPC
jgi:hypothetical protein